MFRNAFLYILILEYLTFIIDTNSYRYRCFENAFLYILILEHLIYFYYRYKLIDLS